jgi:hypothetical protein
MEKILIHTDDSKVNDTLSHCEQVAAIANELTVYLQGNVDKSYKLTPELIADVIKTGGKSIVQFYRNDQDKKLDKVGLSGKVKSDMLRNIDEDITDELRSFQRKFTERGNYSIHGLDVIQYLTFSTKGIEVSENSLEQIKVLNSVYVETPEQFELYKAQQAAVKALNDLREVTRKLAPSTFFITPMHFHAAFFEWDSKSETVSAKAINYNII